jgi:hypothetical protein
MDFSKSYMWSKIPHLEVEKSLCHNSRVEKGHFAHFCALAEVNVLLNCPGPGRENPGWPTALFFLGRGRFGQNAQRMDVGIHQVTDRHIDESMASDGGQTGELVRYDPNPEMALAVPGAFMSNMHMAFVDNFQFLGLEGTHEASTNFDDSLLVHGNTRLNGLTTTLL